MKTRELDSPGKDKQLESHALTCRADFSPSEILIVGLVWQCYAAWNKFRVSMKK